MIDLYHDHGTCEQFHSKLKSDMDVERLPFGKLCVNKIILLCAMAAFSLLRSIGQEVIARVALAPQKINVMCWRIKTVLKISFTVRFGSYATPDALTCTLGNDVRGTT